VAASRRRSGTNPAARSFDAMISATALANGLPLRTADPADFADFAGVDGLIVRPVPSAAR